MMSPHEEYLSSHIGCRFVIAENEEELSKSKWKEYNLEDYNEKINHIELRGDEIVIDLDIGTKNDEGVIREGNLKKAKEAITQVTEKLRKEGIGFRVFDHQGRSPHIYFYSSRDIQRQDKEIIIRYYLPDEFHNFIDDKILEKHLVSVPFAKHYHTGKIKELVEEFIGNLVDVDDDKYKYKKQLSKTSHSPNIVSPLSIFGDKTPCDAINSLIKNGVSEGKRNSCANLIVQQLRDFCGYNKEECLKVLKEYNNNCNPPRAEKEILSDLNEQYKKQYFYNCNSEEYCNLCPFKNKEECSKHSLFMRKKNDEKKSTKTTQKIQRAVRAATNKLDLAREFISIQPLYYDKYKNWWLWDSDDYCWSLIDETDLLNAISDSMDVNTIDSKEKNELIESLKQAGRRNKPLDAPKTWIQFKDDVIDIVDKRKFKATSKYFITNPIPWKIGNTKDIPTIDKLFREWVVNKKQNESWTKTLYEICAYSLLPDYPLHIIFALIGDGGNGKGSFERFIEKFVGERNCASSDIELLSNTQSERAKIFKKLVCIIGEMDKGIFSQTKWLKRLSGDDTTPMRDLYKKSMDFRNYAKIIIAANKLPATPDKKRGFFRRWVCVDFENVFENKGIKIENTIPDIEFENLCLISIDILHQLLLDGKFTNQGSVEDQEKRYEERSSPIIEFIKKTYEEDSSSWIVLSDFCNDYNNFIQLEKLPKASTKEIASILRLKGYVLKVEHNKKYGRDSTAMSIMGLRAIKDEEL